MLPGIIQKYYLIQSVLILRKTNKILTTKLVLVRADD